MKSEHVGKYYVQYKLKEFMTQTNNARSSWMLKLLTGTIITTTINRYLEFSYVFEKYVAIALSRTMLKSIKLNITTKINRQIFAASSTGPPSGMNKR